MIVATLSFQGAGLILITRFLREQQSSWAESFGLLNRRRQAVVLGLLAALIFLPLGWGLQQASALVMTHLPHFKIEPKEQLPIHALRVSMSWGGRLGHRGSVGARYRRAALRGILPRDHWQASAPAPGGTSLRGVHTNLSFVPLAVLAPMLTALYERTDNCWPHRGSRAVQRAEFRHAAAVGNGWIMNEFDLIQRLTRALPTNLSHSQGAGDDCAADPGVPDWLLRSRRTRSGRGAFRPDG
jgi:hypothetical protein